MATLEAGKLDPARLELATKAFLRERKAYVTAGQKVDPLAEAILAYLSGPERAAEQMLAALNAQAEADDSIDEEWTYSSPLNVKARNLRRAAIAAAQVQP